MRCQEELIYSLDSNVTSGNKQVSGEIMQKMLLFFDLKFESEFISFRVVVVIQIFISFVFKCWEVIVLFFTLHF